VKILILGAGQVGSSAAYHLSREEANEVTVVDMRPEVLRELQDRLDIRTVVGHAAYPDVLQRSGANDADIVVALTDSDETNMVACQVAYTKFHTPTKIARIRAAEYMNSRTLFAQDAIPIDVRISPEQLVCEYVEQLILYPGASQVLDFADGRVRLVGVIADRDGLLVGQKLATLKEHIPNTEGRIAAIYRRGKAMLPDGDTIVQEGDEVFFIADRKDIRVFMSEIRRLEDPVRRVVIAGGGNIGVRLALALEQTNQVKIIERDPKRARQISEQVAKAIVLVGDAADEELLLEENVDAVDVFVRDHQLRRGQHPELDACQAPRCAQGDGTDQPAVLRRPRRGRQHRHCHFAAAGHDRLAACTRAPRRRREGALAPARRGRGY
jgi:trk system potassium uptake protein TrkA